MCRHLAYVGPPVTLEKLVIKPEHSLLQQAFAPRYQTHGTINADGFGVGWYGEDTDSPAVVRDIGPAWSDRNLREIARHVVSPLFFGHIRASTGTAVQQTNCHPFRHGRWLFVHNGYIAPFAGIRRELAFAIDPDRFPTIQGSTDTEIVFHLALSLGLEDDPVAALERTVGVIEATRAADGTPGEVQATFGVADGERVVVTLSAA